MPYASSMLPVLLPIALFVVTLIIIFTLRASDKSSKSLSNVKKLLDIYKGNAEASDNSLKQYATELEQTISKKDAEVKGLIQTVNAQLGELRSYSEDLARLKNAMETYRVALEGLGRLTSDADNKVSEVQKEADRLDKVRAVIDGFRQDMKDADEHLRKHEQRVIQLERESIVRMNDAVRETDSSMDEAMASLHKESNEVFEDFKAKTSNDTDFRLRKLDDAFQAVIHTVQQFFGELENKIDEARAVAERLESSGTASGTASGIMPSSPAVKQASSDVPKIVTADIGAPKTGLGRADLSSEIAELSVPVPETDEKSRSDMQKPKFKTPKFTPKTEEEFAEEENKTNLEPEEEDTCGEGINETDDFASFGGVEDESDLRGMDIMDMDFNAFEEKSPRRTKNGSGSYADISRGKWETYGREEVIDFDDDNGKPSKS